MSADLLTAEIGSELARETGDACRPEDLRRYAEASGDLNPLHLDRDFARAAGFDDLVVHGMLNMARLGRLLTSRYGPARLCSFATRFEGVLLVGQPTVLTMQLVARTDAAAEVEILMCTPDGRRIASGRAAIRLAV
ncbi:MAG: MaoC/PaaZ C-terminal domain-containing protein [Thauera propionica]|jgi:acyl dehydratase|nr:MaoC/PaaZ C-terminal domain-containing protein [Thauera propionica]